MKRLLRSVLDCGGTIMIEHLAANYMRLKGANIEWLRPDDQRIYSFIQMYFQTRLDLPSLQTAVDYFTRGEDVEAIERLKDIEASNYYVRTNFVHLLQSLLEDQNKVRAVALLKESHDIITKGLELKEGRNKVRKQGVRDGILHFNEHASGLIVSEYTARTHGDIRADGKEMWEEYLQAKMNKGKVWGKLTGLTEIDAVCHGIKRGELWTHAAFPGQLKCLPGDAFIFDHKTSRRRTVGELFENSDLPCVTALSHEGRENKLVVAEASHLVQNGIRPVYDLVLSSGRRLGAADNHGFLTPHGWVELKEIRPGDFVAVPRIMNVVTPTDAYSDAEVKIVGYLLGDGSLNGSITLSGSNKAIREDFKDCLVAVGMREGEADYKTPAFSEKFPPERVPYIMVSHSKGDGNSDMVSPVWRLLDKLGLYGTLAESKHIPGEFFGLPNEQIVLLLGALWSTDGSCHAKDHARKDRKCPRRMNSISYGSKSLRLCLDIQSLLLRLGISSSVIDVDSEYKGQPYRFYSLQVVTNPSKRLFTKLIRVAGKENQFEKITRRLPEGDNRLFPSCLLPEDVKVKTPNGKWRYSRWLRKRPTVRADVLKHFLPDVPLGDIVWEEVKSVTYRGEEMTYDISVPEHHTFVANDIITHNTSFAINWAYNLTTRYRTNVVYWSLEMPYEQVRRNFAVIHSTNKKWALKGYKPLDYRKIRDGELSEQEEEFYRILLEDWTNDPDYCHCEIIAPDHEVTIDEIKTETELLHKQFDVGFMVLDHGQEIEARRSKKGGGNDNYVIEINSVVRDAKRMALHFNHGEKVPVLLLFQINRQGYDAAEKEDGHYKISAINYANQCCAEGTLVSTDRGLIPIESVQPGLDKVWSRSGWKPALDKFDQGVQPTLIVKTDMGLTLQATHSHRLRVLRGGNVDWEQVSKLQPGDTVLGSIGFITHTLHVLSVEVGPECRVWDLEVPGDHEYVTGGLLSHNCEKSSDVITTTYFDDAYRGREVTRFCCLKNRDNPKFESFLAHANMVSRRIKSGVHNTQGMAVDDRDAGFNLDGV